MLRRVLAVLALSLPLVLVSTSASAAPSGTAEPPVGVGEDCAKWNLDGSLCLEARAPGSGGSGGDDAGTGYGDEDSGGASGPIWLTTDSDQRCLFQGVTDPQPSKEYSIWDGHADGVILDCMLEVCLDNPGRDFIPDCAMTQVWAAGPPDAEVPDPAVLAQRAVAKMQLQPIDIGIVPEEGPDRVGIVGMPQWMWVNEPARNTFGPITRSARAGQFRVTATAKVDRIVWDMGDGTTVECVGAGTPYEDRFDVSDSPDCGHHYTKQGDYEVTATSYWIVEWEGIGQSGTIRLDFTSTANIVMGEAQVITQ